MWIAAIKLKPTKYYKMKILNKLESPSNCIPRIRMVIPLNVLQTISSRNIHSDKSELLTYPN